MNKEKFFFISIICRLKNTTSWLLDNNIIEHSDRKPKDPLAALFKHVLLDADNKKQSKGEENKKLSKELSVLYEKVLVNSTDKKLIRDPQWNQTPYDYAVLWIDKGTPDNQPSSWHGQYLVHRLKDNENNLR